MKQSIKKILQWDKDIKIYPGHGNATNLFREKPVLEYFYKQL
jgi:glyoxylase-like metal-dependent hydrolase (beta-lactamase superfamily II)